MRLNHSGLARALRALRRRSQRFSHRFGALGVAIGNGGLQAAQKILAFNLYFISRDLAALLCFQGRRKHSHEIRAPIQIQFFFEDDACLNFI